MDVVAQLVVHMDSMKTTKDGGGKITFEFGANSMKEVHKVIDWHGEGGVNFWLVLVPHTEKEPSLQEIEFDERY